MFGITVPDQYSMFPFINCDSIVQTQCDVPVLHHVRPLLRHVRIDHLRDSRHFDSVFPAIPLEIMSLHHAGRSHSCPAVLHFLLHSQQCQDYSRIQVGDFALGGLVFLTTVKLRSYRFEAISHFFPLLLYSVLANKCIFKV